MHVQTPNAQNVQRALRLEVPLVVVLGERMLPTREVIALVPGAIIELPKTADEELDVLVNNRRIGSGLAVKVGENFGIRISRVEGATQRLEAIGNDPPARTTPQAVPESPPTPQQGESTIG
jgi:flagellar motor switch protein FliN/FliY